MRAEPAESCRRLAALRARLPVLVAARAHLVAWAAGGAPPPSFPLIELTGEPPHIQRDEHGNARGGIRMPELEVPVAMYRGAVDGASRSASHFGSTERFPREQLRALYPSPDAYWSAYEDAVDRAVHAGFFLERDADDIKAAAAAAASDVFAEPGASAG